VSRIFVCRKALLKIENCFYDNYALIVEIIVSIGQSVISKREMVRSILKKTFNPFTQILNRLVDGYLCRTFGAYGQYSLANGSKFKYRFIHVYFPDNRN